MKSNLDDSHLDDGNSHAEQPEEEIGKVTSPVALWQEFQHYVALHGVVAHVKEDNEWEVGGGVEPVGSGCEGQYEMQSKKGDDGQDYCELEPNFARNGDIVIFSQLVQLDNLSKEEDSKEDIEDDAVAQFCI